MRKIRVFMIGKIDVCKKINAALKQQKSPIQIAACVEEHALAAETMKRSGDFDIILTTRYNEEHNEEYLWCCPKAKIVFWNEEEDVRLQPKVDAVLEKTFTMRTFTKTITELLTEETKVPQQIDQQYKALSDATRRKILDYLQEKTYTAGDLTTLCETTKPNMSQHLKVLKNSGLIQEEKKGLYVYYSLSRFDFSQTKKGVNTMLNIKDKILLDIQQLAYKKNCEPVVGATDSQDDGTFYIMKDTETLISFHYSFRLSSFSITFELPLYRKNLGNYQVRYDEPQKIEEIYEMITEDLHQHVSNEEKKKKTHEKIREEVKKYMNEKTRNMEILLTKDEETKRQFNVWMDEYIQLKYSTLMDKVEIEVLKKEVSDDLMTLGKIQPFLDDVSVSEIMINAPHQVWVEANGRLIKTDIVFADSDELLRLARKIATYAGKRIDSTSRKMVVVLPDYSRVIMLFPPAPVQQMTIIIRKPHDQRLKMADLITSNAVSEEAATFLKAMVQAKANILISGGSGVGKNTVLNAMTPYIPNEERIIAIDDTGGMPFSQPHVVRLMAHLGDEKGVGAFSFTDCFKTGLTLHADRFVMEEIRDEVAFDVVEAHLTSYTGLLASIHGNSSMETLEHMSRLMIRNRGEYPIEMIQKTIGDAVDLVVQVERLKDGSRRIARIDQIFGYHPNFKDFSIEPLFEWKTELSGQEKFINTEASLIPRLVQKLAQHNVMNPLERKMDNRENKEFEMELPYFVQSLAEHLHGGLSLSQAACYAGDTESKLLYEVFCEVDEKTKNGMPTSEALIEVKDRFLSPQWHFLIRVLTIHLKNSGLLATILPILRDILEERMELLKGKTNEERAILFASDDWAFMEFTDLLACVYPACGSLGDAIEKVHTELPDNRFSKVFYTAVEEIRSGRTFEMAFEEASAQLNHMKASVLFVKKVIATQNLGTGMEKTLTTVANRVRSWMSLEQDKRD